MSVPYKLAICTIVLLLQGGLARAAPQPGGQAAEAPSATTPAPAPLNPGTATLARTVGRTTVWTTRTLLEHTVRNRAQTFTTRYWVQEFGEGAAPADARLAHEETSTGASEVLTIFPDGTLLLRSGATVLSWVERGKKPSVERPRLDGQEAVVLAAWPDGVLVQEHALNTSKPVYFAAGARRSVNLDAKVRITNEQGVDVNWVRQFVRSSDRIAWLSVGLVSDPVPRGPRSVNILHLYDLDDDRRKDLTLARPAGPEILAFDGRRALLRDSVVDVDTGAQTAAPRLAAAVTLHGSFVYHMRDHGDRYALEAIRLSDAPEAEAAPKELRSVPAYPLAGMRQRRIDPEGGVTRHGPTPRQLNRAAVPLEDGIRVWTGKDWAKVPYAD